MLDPIDQLARLRAHIEGRLPLPPDLGRWTLSMLADGLCAREAREARDRLIRAAALQLPGVPHAKARALVEEARRLPRRAMPPPPCSVAGLLAEAQRIHPLPASARHYIRVLTAV